MSSLRLMIGGGLGGGPENGLRGGVRMPSRTMAASFASASIGLRSGRGGPSSATTRSRFVTRTVSPAAAMRTYSLSLLFSVLRPTDLMPMKVATSGCFVKTDHRPVAPSHRPAPRLRRQVLVRRGETRRDLSVGQR